MPLDLCRGTKANGKVSVAWIVIHSFASSAKTRLRANPLVFILNHLASRHCWQGSSGLNDSFKGFTYTFPHLDSPQFAEPLVVIEFDEYKHINIGNAVSL